MPAPDTASAHPIILFDAQCVLCSANAQFVLRHDRRGHFRLASMQGEVGAGLYRRFGMDPADPSTLIVIEGERMRQDSDAVLAIYTALGWPWRAAAALRVVPRFVRDPLYRLIARNRYRLFGRRETCWVPLPEHRERVL
jgi:predicted DCC family thiol-disulfide oxidoreductase YuxK